jgi:hypothetical protein
MALAAPGPGIPVPPAGIQYSYDSAEKSLSDQLAQIDGLDTKIGVIVAALGVAIGFLFAGTLDLWIRIVLGILLGVSLAAAGGGFYTGRNQYLAAPDPEAVNRYSALPDDVLKTLFVNNILIAFTTNASRLARKARFFKVSVASLGLAALFHHSADHRQGLNGSIVDLCQIPVRSCRRRPTNTSMRIQTRRQRTRGLSSPRRCGCC